MANTGRTRNSERAIVNSAVLSAALTSFAPPYQRLGCAAILSQSGSRAWIAKGGLSCGEGLIEGLFCRSHNRPLQS
jgi:hypothetical protein